MSDSAWQRKRHSLLFPWTEHFTYHHRSHLPMTKTLLTELPKLIDAIESNDNKEELIQLINEQVAYDTYKIE